MPIDPTAVVPVLFAAGREEALRPLLVQLVVIVLAARAGAAVRFRGGEPPPEGGRDEAGGRDAILAGERWRRQPARTRDLAGALAQTPRARAGAATHASSPT